jgi:tetrahydromethanopterin S-methyltransferase subunit H
VDEEKPPIGQKTPHVEFALTNSGTGPDNRLSATLKFLSRWRRPICGGIFPISWLWSSFRTFKKDKLAILDGISPEKLLKDRSRLVMYGSLLEMSDGIGP